MEVGQNDVIYIGLLTTPNYTVCLLCSAIILESYSGEVKSAISGCSFCLVLLISFTNTLTVWWILLEQGRGWQILPSVIVFAQVV
jgi:hypothetical protein